MGGGQIKQVFRSDLRNHIARILEKRTKVSRSIDEVRATLK
jgi:hypothetical protein